MKVQDVMTKGVVSCRPETNLAVAAALMWDHDCGTLPVVDDAGKLTGLITDRDMCIALGTRNRLPSEITAGEVACGRVRACKPCDDIHTALKMMCCAHVHRIPVVDTQGVLVGVLSIDDVVRRAQHVIGTKRPDISYEDVVNTLRGICAHGAQVRNRRAA